MDRSRKDKLAIECRGCHRQRCRDWEERRQEAGEPSRPRGGPSFSFDNRRVTLKQAIDQIRKRLGLPTYEEAQAQKARKAALAAAAEKPAPRVLTAEDLRAMLKRKLEERERADPALNTPRPSAFEAALNRVREPGPQRRGNSGVTPEAQGDRLRMDAPAPPAPATSRPPPPPPSVMRAAVPAHTPLKRGQVILRGP